jgi:flagellar motor component MotA
MSRLVCLFVAMGLFVSGILMNSDLCAFFDVPSLLIVVLSSLLLAMAHHGVGGVVDALSAAVSSRAGGDPRIEQHIEVMQTLRNLFCASAGVGTLIGLVSMLQNMDDPSAIGPAMAVALLTAFYGLILAELFVAPSIRRLRVATLDRPDGSDGRNGSMSKDQGIRGVATLGIVMVFQLLAFFVLLLSFN